MNYPLIRKCIVIGILTLTCSSVASAARINGFTSAQVFSSIPNGTDQQQDVFDYDNPALLLTPQSFSTSASFAVGSANSGATASLGTISVSGVSTYAHIDSNSTAQNRTIVRAVDTVTVTGTNPLGGVTFTLGVTGTNSGLIPVCCGNPFWTAYFDFYATTQVGNTIVSLQWNEDSLYGTSGTSSTTVYGLQVGDQISLSYGADLGTHLDGQSTYPTRSIFADYTAHFYADAGPGTSIVSSTNFDYSSATVPEPSTGVLLGGVLLGAAFIRRRLA